MKLLIELQADYQEIEILNEQDEKTGKKKTRIKAPFIVAEEKNKNRRIYPKVLVEREVKRYTKENIDKRMSLGELDHPSSPTVSGKNAAIAIDELIMDGNIAIGTATIVSTPNGDIVRGVLEDGYAWGLSSRGLGTLGGGGIVNSDYHYICEDVVTDPSAYGAIADRLMENADYMIDEHGLFVEIAIDNMKKKMDKKYGREEVTLALKEFIRQISERI